MGIIHCTDSDKEATLKDYNQIVNHKVKAIDLKRGLKFIEIPCSTIHEAKRRALTIALLTYVMKSQTFIRCFTKI